MKKAKIEKQLKQDLQSSSLPAFDKVWQQCDKKHATLPEFQTEASLATAGNFNYTQTNNSKRKINLISIAVGIIVVISLILGAFFGLFKSGESLSKGYFILDINPSIEVDYNEKGKVTEVIGLNNDGKVLLYGIEESLIGKPYNEAVKTLFDRCLVLGYFSADFDNNAVLVSAMKYAGEQDNVMTENVRNEFSKQFVNKKICGVAIAGKEDSSLKEVASGYGIDVQKYSLIQEYVTLCTLLNKEIEITESQYSTISIREIYEEIEDLEDEIEEYDIGDRISDSLEDIIERLQNETQGEINAKMFEQEIERIEDAKSFEECKGCANNLLTILADVKRNTSNSIVIQKIEMASQEIMRVIDDINVEESKRNLTIEEIFNDLENRFQGNANKEGVEPDGGFGTWQKGKEQELVNANWKDLKNDWQNGRKN